MTPWIQVYANLHTHPKTYKLAQLLSLKSAAVQPNTIATGLLTNLWCWAAVNAPDGDLSNVPHQCLADGAGWKQSPEKFWSALVDAGFIDEAEGTACLHDWLDYASLLLEQEQNRKKKTKERVQRYRDKQKAAQEAPCNAPCNVTETPGNASTVPNLTRPNQTFRKQAQEIPPEALQADRETYRQIHGSYPAW